MLDAIGYGDFTGAVFLGEGIQSVDGTEGNSLTRSGNYKDSDTNNNSVDFSEDTTPSPGE